MSRNIGDKKSFPIPIKYPSKKVVDSPLVSVSVMTYQHADFIKECLDGILMQKTDFKFEVLIHDDASNDGTEEIIREYEAKYPDIIKPLYEKENQWVKGRRGSKVFNFPRARGKYIAMCEGDDYWTDPYKLQKQVDFLEANKEYSLCVANYVNSYESNNDEYRNRYANKKIDVIKSSYSFSLKEMQENWITKTLTAVFRKDVLESFDLSIYKYTRDIHLFYHLVKNYKGYYFDEVFGVYRIHDGGINSVRHGEFNYNIAYKCYKELWLFNRDEFTRIMFYKHILALLNYNIYHNYLGNSLGKNVSLYKEAVMLVRKINEIRFLLSVLIPNDVKNAIKKNKIFKYFFK